MYKYFKTLLLLFLLQFTLLAQDRVALVIGNANYLYSDVLKNPINDAALMRDTLKERGFFVLYYEDTSLAEMKKALTKFSKISKDAKTSLFYYAGHGIEVRGKNYLIAIDSKITSDSEVKYNALSLSNVSVSMKQALNDTNIIILDACRSNLFGTHKNGLAPFSNPDGMFIAYAAQAGEVSYDGEGKNGIFTANLVKNIKVDNLNIEEVFKRTREDVYKETIAQQRPSTYSELIGSFYFTKTDEKSTRAIKRNQHQIIEVKKHKRYIEPQMVLIKKGTFMMGDNDDIEASPQHKVEIKKDFYMAVHEISFEEYDLFCKDTGHKKPSDSGYGREQQALINVSHHDALEYAHWLSKKSKKSYSLPSEAQWEYAARTDTQGSYSFGNENKIDLYAWYSDNAKNHPYPVGLKRPNPWGLYDMYGNVKEWCLDNRVQYHKIKDQKSSLQGIAYLDENRDEMIIRGGAYNSEYDEVGSSIRESENRYSISRDIGFRLILEP